MRAYSIREALQQGGATTELYLHGLSLCEAPEEVWSLPNLEVLDLENNQIEQVPEAVALLTGLRILRLSGNPLREVPAALERLPLLEEIYLSRCEFRTLPGVLSNCRALKKLDLSGNRIKTCALEKAQWGKLESLNLEKNALSAFPSGLENAPCLRTLDLAHNRIAEISASSRLPIGLESLDLRRNRIAGIPGHWGALTQLRHLDLSQNRLEALPEAVRQLRQLRQLKLDDNALTRLPDFMAELPVLDALNLRNNQLSELPEALSSMPSLSTLNLAGNPLHRLPPLPENLRALDVSKTAIEALPESLIRLARLRALDVSYTQIPEIPPLLAQLPRLEQLIWKGYPTGPVQDTRLLMHFPALKTLTGVLPAAGWRRLHKLIAAGRKAGFGPEGLFTLNRIEKMGPEAEINLPQEQALKALSLPFPPLRRALTGWLLSHFPASGLEAAHRIGWFGRPKGVPLGFWKERLESCGLRMAAKGDVPTHLVIGEPPYPESPSPMPLPGILDLPVLESYLAREESRYLQTEEDAGQADRLQRMLRSRDTGFLRLAIPFIQGGGLPPRLRTDLFLAWKLCPDPGLRAELRQLLRRHLPFGDQKALSRSLPLHLEMDPAALRRQMERLTEGTGLDAGIVEAWKEYGEKR
ncbi:MAG: leucine-rich repeat protein [Haliscomenobacter sp.]|nr:leucine-rich repeat protein [Haliscomenobacter sp.]